MARLMKQTASMTCCRRSILLLPQTIENEFNTAGNSEFVKDLKKIIANDSGSTVLGFGISFLGLDYYRAHSGGGSSLFFPILAAGLPLLDCAIAILRRLRSRVLPSCGDRRHFYDLLLARGWSPRSVVLTCYILTAALVTIGWLGTQGSRLNAFLSCTFTLGALLSAGLWLGSLEPERPNPQAQRAQSGGL